MVRILSIDDARAVHAFLKDILSSVSVELDHAYDGKEGIKKISEQKIPYDLILLDWEMPGMTGPEVLKELKNRKVVSPIIMLTSKNELNDIQNMLENGAAEYVMKPFTLEILVGKIETVLGQSIEQHSQVGQ